LIQVWDYEYGSENGLEQGYQNVSDWIEGLAYVVAATRNVQEMIHWMHSDVKILSE
jgi:hypothetical protein